LGEGKFQDGGEKKDNTRGWAALDVKMETKSEELDRVER
jgi:hypothetical protein